MQVKITGRHHHVTQAMKDYAGERVEHFKRYDDRVSKVEIILNVERNNCFAEMIAHATAGVQLIAKENDSDMYAAIDRASDKLETQIKKNRERIVDHKAEKLDFDES